MRLHLQVGCKTCFFWAVRREGFGGAHAVESCVTSMISVCVRKLPMTINRADGRKAWVTGLDHVYQWHPARMLKFTLLRPLIHVATHVPIIGGPRCQAIGPRMRDLLLGWVANRLFGAISSARVNCMVYVCIFLAVCNFCTSM